MVIQLDTKHENAIRWGFEKQNAESIAGILKEAESGKTMRDNIYGLYMTYREETASSMAKLSNLLSDYNHAKDKMMALKVLRAARAAGIDYEKLQPNYLKREGRG